MSIKLSLLERAIKCYVWVFSFKFLSILPTSLPSCLPRGKEKEEREKEQHKEVERGEKIVKLILTFFHSPFSSSLHFWSTEQLVTLKKERNEEGGRRKWRRNGRKTQKKYTKVVNSHKCTINFMLKPWEVNTRAQKMALCYKLIFYG